MKKLLLITLLILSVNAIYSQTNIRKGSNSYGTVLYNWDGENLRQGSNSYGTCYD